MRKHARTRLSFIRQRISYKSDVQSHDSRTESHRIAKNIRCSLAACAVRASDRPPTERRSPQRWCYYIVANVRAVVVQCRVRALNARALRVCVSFFSAAEICGTHGVLRMWDRREHSRCLYKRFNACTATKRTDALYDDTIYAMCTQYMCLQDDARSTTIGPQIGKRET